MSKKLVKHEGGSLPGEHHGLIVTKKGVSRANYMGPGTRLDVRIPRGDKGKSPVDKASKAHDLRYSLYGTKGEQAADRKFNQVVNKIQKEGTDYKANIAQAKLVKAKSALGIKASLFTTLGNTPPALKPVYKRELKKLEQQGYGNSLAQRAPPHSASRTSRHVKK
eukprot:Lithocolla_globosa_v1_NODE_837_length_3207_cov_25.878490.p2 type:complete len:165 gc:universal NODE_837_length_3207_cov_25.878490:1187-693(-)